MAKRIGKWTALALACALFSLLTVFSASWWASAAPADVLFDEGRAKLEDFMISENPNDLIAADQKFQDALAEDENHYGACFYYSITRLWLLPFDPDIEDMMDDFGIVDFVVPDVLPTDSPTSGEVIDLLVTKFASETSGPDSALEYLGRIPDDWTGVTVTTAEFPMDEDAKVAAAEARAFAAGIKALQGVLSVLWGIDLDVDIDEIWNSETTQINSLLAAYPDLLTMRSPGGRGALENARTLLLAAIDLAGDCVDLVELRTTPDNWMMYFEDPDDIQEVRADLSEAESFLSGTVVLDPLDIEDFDRDTNFDLTKFFTTLVPRSVLPQFDAESEPLEGTFPDPTMAGMMPDTTQGWWTGFLRDEPDWLWWDFQAPDEVEINWSQTDYPAPDFVRYRVYRSQTELVNEDSTQVFESTSAAQTTFTDQVPTSYEKYYYRIYVYYEPDDPLGPGTYSAKSFSWIIDVDFDYFFRWYSISPQFPTMSPGEYLHFTTDNPEGGTWVFAYNNTGGSIDPVTGVYRAGSDLQAPVEVDGIEVGSPHGYAYTEVDVEEQKRPPGQTGPATSMDLDGGGLGLSDVIMMLRYVVGIGTPSPEEVAAGDFNVNGDIDLADVINALRVVFGLPPIL